ncbi:sulfatase-like hydrolase/transferase [Flavivirga abyssicola]|uniref:sulfatase-like hydrolase/transferase n=1 Tax=Flavivirga abyssicola TaxID=3063533 RepID=UPI0026DF906E|nr:sulfatase-like hydrolase/transferase [Flavivirga sp. MEBiC07777]WVK11789.1 sulfatase-like hydrolase/transferase [Flavivirga sp. MEBiC07777]
MKSLFKITPLFTTITLLIISHFQGISQSPNIVFILLDDLGYADVGFNGGTDIATPNIDALADNGTIFTSAYVTHPFCGPSRAGLMTGRYPHKIGAQYNLNDNEYVLGVDTNETFFSKVLQDAGYNTALIGKWHLGQSAAHQPNSRGFDYFYGMLTGGHNYFTKTAANGGFNGAYNRDLRENGGLANEPANEYITDLFSDKGVAFIQDAETNDSDPFFLFMSYNAPHSPIQSKTSDENILTNPPYSFSYSNDRRKQYAAMVYAVDRGIKNIVDALIAANELDNTLIVFLSDNGGRLDNTGMANNAPLRGAKGDTYEGGFRVPMFMHWPDGNIPIGASYDYPVSSLDLYPTFVNLAGASIPNGKEIDGKDILNNIIINTNARAGESIFAMRHKKINNVGIRRDQWKAYTTGNGVWRLYNIDNDKGESNNLSAQYPAILNSMIDDAYQWSKTHITPQFFDSIEAENNWNANLPKFEITFPGYLSVEDILIDETVSGYVYPNPTVKSNLTITFNGNLTNAVDVIIYDTLGHPVQIEKNLLKESPNKVGLKLNPNITNGNYFIHITSGTNSFSKAFIINR